MQEQNGKIFESVYTIDGKVFIKMLKTDSNDSAIHVKTKSMVIDLLANLAKRNSGSTTDVGNSTQTLNP